MILNNAIIHKNIREDDLLDVIKVKSSSWNYSYEQHLSWIQENLTEDCIHFLLRENDEPIAYLNFIPITIAIDGVKFNALGVGNVCSVQKGKGHGKLLMENCNNYINQSRKIGVLFCKQSLVGFYSKLGWEEVESELVNILPIRNFQIIAMTLNCPKVFRELYYNGKIF